ncbi:unnamed protein product [Lathyrus sativus]|nr:unnamed protein product [Lathyrus sativus]
MVFQNLINSAVLTLCVLVLSTCNYQACAFGKFGKFGNFENHKWASKDHFWDRKKDDYVVRSICADLITTHGYKCDEFEVTTNAGYILSIQRIPVGRSESSSNATREPVIIQHGIMMDGASWFMNSPAQNLPMILADNGFDVWITNGRGTKYSRKHTTFDSSKKQYWNWGPDELVSDELPAIINFVFKQTGQKINYLGHSLGTMVALLSLSEGKWVNEVKSVALLCPISYIGNMKAKLATLSMRSERGKKYTARDFTEFKPKGRITLSFIRVICATFRLNCNDLFTALTGENCCLDRAAFVRLAQVEPQSTSKKTLYHLSSIYLNDIVAKFDYGRREINQRYYGQPKPPIYNLSNIPNNIPIFMSYGGKDALSDVADVQRLLSLHFQNHDKAKLNVQFIHEYAHFDYMMGVNANDLVYKHVASFFKQKF